MTQSELAGKTALVTGGSKGIGAAVATALAAKGCRVTVIGRDQSGLAKLATTIAGTFAVVDLGVRTSLDSFLSTHGNQFDIVVNNAGIAQSAALAATDDDNWDQTMEVNTTAPFRLIRAVLPHMVAAKWGRVINIASNAGVAGYAYTSAYCASKHALVGLTRALAVEIARTGITVNAICPGWVATEMAASAANNIASKTGRTVEQATATLEAMSPQRRLIEAEEIADCVTYLCGHQARGVHGQAIVIDGGQIQK